MNDTTTVEPLTRIGFSRGTFADILGGSVEITGITPNSHPPMEYHRVFLWKAEAVDLAHAILDAFEDKP